MNDVVEADWWCADCGHDKHEDGCFFPLTIYNDHYEGEVPCGCLKASE